MPEYIEYQRKMLLWLSYITVCRFSIDRDSSGQYLIKKCGRIKIGLYYFLWLNTFVKIGYLLLTYHGYTVEVHFLDQMSMWDFFLCFSQLVQEVNMWYRKYPMYEVIHANWKVQEDIFKRLGSPETLNNKINKNDRSLVHMHTVIVVVGCTAIGLQNIADPKYALNTYAIIPYENLPLQLLLTAHEVIFIFHIWVHQAGSIILCEVFSVTYTHMINEMTEVMNKLSSLAEEGNVSTEAKTTAKKINPVNNKKNPNNRIEESSSKSHLRLRHSDASAIKTFPMVTVDPHTLISRNQHVNPETVVPGTSYDIETLLRDYTNLMLATDSFNKWVGKLMAGTNGSNYGQFISDVFMMIQLLKEPGTDFMAVTFYFEDACAGMLMLFRMLILMSRMYPASEEFLQAFKVYLTYESPIKKYLLKYETTLKIVAAKIGGYKTRPITVPKGVNALMNYYIAAAMWQRPKDRMT